MNEAKTQCTKCATSILQSTADQNNGQCKPCAAGPKPELVAESMELGIRCSLGLVFAVLIGGLGYAIGSMLGAIGGFLVALFFSPVGFVYGFFSVEINSIIRSVFSFTLDP